MLVFFTLQIFVLVTLLSSDPDQGPVLDTLLYGAR